MKLFSKKEKSTERPELPKTEIETTLRTLFINNVCKLNSMEMNLHYVQKKYNYMKNYIETDTEFLISPKMKELCNFKLELLGLEVKEYEKDADVLINKIKEQIKELNKLNGKN